MTDTGQTPAGQRTYGTPLPPPGSYHTSGPTAVSYNGIGDPQGPGVYRQPGPAPDFQPGLFYSAPGSQRPGAGVFPKSTGLVGRPGWAQMRYGGAPQSSTVNQMLQGPSADGWVTEYGQTPRSNVDGGVGGSQPGWHPQQQHQQQHLASPTGPSSYSNRQQPPSQNTQVCARFELFQPLSRDCKPCWTYTNRGFAPRLGWGKTIALRVMYGMDGSSHHT